MDSAKRDRSLVVDAWTNGQLEGIKDADAQQHDPGIGYAKGCMGDIQTRSYLPAALAWKLLPTVEFADPSDQPVAVRTDAGTKKQSTKIENLVANVSHTSDADAGKHLCRPARWPSHHPVFHCEAHCVWRIAHSGGRVSVIRHSGRRRF